MYKRHFSFLAEKSPSCIVIYEWGFPEHIFLANQFSSSIISWWIEYNRKLFIAAPHYLFRTMCGQMTKEWWRQLCKRQHKYIKKTRIYLTSLFWMKVDDKCRPQTSPKKAYKICLNEVCKGIELWAKCNRRFFQRDHSTAVAWNEISIKYILCK